MAKDFSIKNQLKLKLYLEKQAKKVEVKPVKKNGNKNRPA